jgi:hypothetical protein
MLCCFVTAVLTMIFFKAEVDRGVRLVDATCSGLLVWTYGAAYMHFMLCDVSQQIQAIRRKFWKRVFYRAFSGVDVMMGLIMMLLMRKSQVMAEGANTFPLCLVVAFVLQPIVQWHMGEEYVASQDAAKKSK